MAFFTEKYRIFPGFARRSERGKGFWCGYSSLSVKSAKNRDLFSINGDDRS